MSKKPEIYVCTNLRLSGASCAGQGAQDVLKALRAAPQVRDGRVVVTPSVCMGYCGEGPNVKIHGGNFHHGVSPTVPEEIKALLDEALKPGEKPGEKLGAKPAAKPGSGENPPKA